MTRLGILATHPIQYYAPWFRTLSRELDVEVMYAVRQTPSGQAAAGFGVEFEWDVPLLDGYRYRWLDNVAARPGLGRFSGANTPEIADVIRREAFDAVLIFGWNYRSAVQAFVACRRRGIPVLFRGDSQLATRRSPVKRALKLVPYRLLLPRAAAHLFVGKRNEAYLRRYGVRPEQLYFCPHFVDNAYFAGAALRASRAGVRARIRSALGIDPEGFVFTYVGKLLPSKQVDHFLKGLESALGWTEAPAHALIVGDGPERSRLEELSGRLGGRAHILGFRNQSRLPELYAASDCLVLPSAQETWGLVVNEAMACGLPAVVSSSVGCGPDLVDEGATGFTYPDGDIAALAQRMISVVTLTHRFGRQLREALADKMKSYSMMRATEGLKAALSSVAA